jgi:hypothetical protein
MLGHMDDVMLVRRMIIRIMREFMQTQLVIAGDANIYQLFESIPEGRKLFLPPATVDEHPYTFSQIDLLFIPMRNIPYNQAQSDRVLVEAGVRKIPWLASPMPAFMEWAEGGILVNSPEKWYECLRQLVTNDQLRSDLGQKGNEKAQQREKDQIGPIWLKVVQECLGSGNAKSSLQLNNGKGKLE